MFLMRIKILKPIASVTQVNKLKTIKMKKIFIFLLIMTACLKVAMAHSFPDFKPLRYDEDYSFLNKDSSNENWYKKTKYSPLSKNGNTYLTFGGEARLQYFRVKNESWGDETPDSDGYVLVRYLVHSDLHVTKYFRAFVQLQGSMINGKASTSPVDEDPLDLHQAFVDFNANPEAQTKVMFRLGRQELSYGSQRLIAVRDGPNNRQAFDAIKAVVSHTGYKADFFYSHYVAAKKGIFDDGWNKNSQFWGSYWVINKVPVLQNIDAYYLGIWKRKATFDDGSGREIRHSIGSRIWGKKYDFKYDLEGLYQFGDFDGKPIKAWTASANVSYELKQIKYKPELGFKAEFISGDKKKGDDKLQTFDPLFPRGAYFGLAALIGPVNLIDIHPSLSFELCPKLDWSMDYDIFWRYSIHDGLYATNGSMLYTGQSSDEKYIGNQLSTEFVYTPEQFLYLRAEFTWFEAGSYLKDVSAGKNILFAGITAQIKF